jgi:hypothetical protein
MLVFISLLGGVVIYELFGSVSGLDAIGISGILSGFVIGLFSGKNLGMFSIFPSFLSASVSSLVFALLAFISMDSVDPVMTSLGLFAIGFSLMAGNVVGCQWGKHFLIREDDIAQLRNVFGDAESTKKPQQNENNENKRSR